jgi:myo-inositol 2-dehydrogenase / D-chiro-inositol 1-dehydrogenase
MAIHRDSAARAVFPLEHDELFNAIREGKPFNEAEYGAHSTMTAILGRMATYSGKMLQWDDALNSKIDYFPEQLAWDAEPSVKPGPDGWYANPVPGTTKVI